MKRRGWGTFEVQIAVIFLPQLQAMCDLKHNLSFDGPHASGTIYALTLPSLTAVRDGVKDRGVKEWVRTEGDGDGGTLLRAEPVGRCTPNREGWAMSGV